MKSHARRRNIALLAMVALATQLTACTVGTPTADAISWQALADSLRTFLGDFARELLAAALV